MKNNVNPNILLENIAVKHKLKYLRNPNIVSIALDPHLHELGHRDNQSGGRGLSGGSRGSWRSLSKSNLDKMNLAYSSLPRKGKSYLDVVNLGKNQIIYPRRGASIYKMSMPHSEGYPNET